MENPNSFTKNKLRKRISSKTLVGVEEAMIRDLSWSKNYERKLAISECLDYCIWACTFGIVGVSMIGIYVAIYL